MGADLRFVMTNLPNVVSAEDARKVYDDYIQRGESEQRMDELKNGLCADRLSCHRFLANFFRLLLHHTAAFNVVAALPQHPDLPPLLQVGQPQTWWTHLIKVAAIIVQNTRRIVVKLAAQCPWWQMYRWVSPRAPPIPRPPEVSRTRISCRLMS